MNIKLLREHPELFKSASIWFHKKWNIPLEAYEESIRQCIESKTMVPQWYVVLNENQDIVAGAGVIENDFHVRKDLTPNVCAVYVEPENRGQGIAKYLLNYIRKDMGSMGIEKLYLTTDHTTFYERCGWKYLCMVEDTEGDNYRMYMITTL